MQPRILMLDIETAPHIAYIWRLWQKTYSMDLVETDWYILCWCAKWLSEKEMLAAALPNYPLYQTEPENDLEVMKTLWPLLDEADIVVGHNAAQFDIKKINTRFLLHGLTPPSPYKTVDTLLIARKYFSFASNKLNDLGQLLRVGKKKDTGGFQLWKDCMSGDLKAWKKMVAYCSQDVKLLEKIYKLLIPYTSHFPNIAVIMEENVCPKCGSPNIQKRGFTHTNAAKYQRWVCKDCGAWSKERKQLSSEGSTLTNI